MSEFDVTVAWIDILVYSFIASKFIYGARDCEAGGQERFYSVELLSWKQLQAGKILQYRTTLWRNGRE
jgi:hypothetical protein